jgi:ankyrin repeat protein
MPVDLVERSQPCTRVVDCSGGHRPVEQTGAVVQRIVQQTLRQGMQSLATRTLSVEVVSGVDAGARAVGTEVNVGTAEGSALRLQDPAVSRFHCDMRPVPGGEGITPLMIAIDNTSYDTARVLLDEGANPHVWDWYGRTALYVATDMSTFRGRQPHPTASSETSATDLVRLLLEAGVNPNPQLNMHRPSRGGNTGRFADELLNTGTTPLLRAAIGADVEAARLLLEHGALVDLPSVHGITPLMAAAGHSSGRGFGEPQANTERAQARAIELIDMFLAAGADINAKITDDSSRTASVGRQPNAVTERKGQNALYGAVKNGWASVVDHLLAYGADPKISDALGRTPVDAALGRVAGRNTVVSEDIATKLRAARGEPIAAR